MNENTNENDVTSREWQIKKVLEARTEIFRRKCPTIYQHSDTTRLPQKQLTAAMRWEFGGRGLFLCGPTGAGKTRIAWHLLRREIMRGRTVRAYDGLTWGADVSRAMYDTMTLRSWCDDITTPDIIFIDDFLKSKITEAQEVAAWEMIERRTASERPMILTANATGASMLERFSAGGASERGEPIIRRISEFFDLILF